MHQPLIYDKDGYIIRINGATHCTRYLPETDGAPIIGRFWPRWWPGAVRQQAISKANKD